MSGIPYKIKGDLTAYLAILFIADVKVFCRK